MTSVRPFDTILRNGRYFDGTGTPAVVRDVGIRDGRIAAVSAHRWRRPAAHG